MIDKLKKLNEDIAELKRQNMEKSKEIFNEVSKDLFDKHECLESFSWAQYTPYFNDGDQCVFSVSEYTTKINGEHDEDDDLIRETKWDSAQSKRVPNEERDPKLSSAYKDVRELIETVDGQAFRDMFGDHVEITVNRSGEINTETYEHD